MLGGGGGIDGASCTTLTGFAGGAGGGWVRATTAAGGEFATAGRAGTGSIAATATGSATTRASGVGADVDSTNASVMGDGESVGSNGTLDAGPTEVMAESAPEQASSAAVQAMRPIALGI
jgi:hypothetical protein